MSDKPTADAPQVQAAPPVLLVAQRRDGQYDFGRIGLHRGWFATDDILARDGTRLVEFVPRGVVELAVRSGKQIDDLASENNARSPNSARYTVAIGESGEYELSRDGRYVGEILFYNDAKVIMEAVWRRATAGNQQAEPIHGRDYRAIAAVDGKYTLRRGGQVVARLSYEEDAERIMRALAWANGADRLHVIPGASIMIADADPGMHPGQNVEWTDEDRRENDHLASLAQDDYLTMWLRTSSAERVEPYKESPVGGILEHLRALSHSLTAPFSHEELGLAISALERVGSLQPNNVERNGNAQNRG